MVDDLNLNTPTNQEKEFLTSFMSKFPEFKDKSGDELLNLLNEGHKKVFDQFKQLSSHLELFNLHLNSIGVLNGVNTITAQYYGVEKGLPFCMKDLNKMGIRSLVLEVNDRKSPYYEKNLNIEYSRNGPDKRVYIHSEGYKFSFSEDDILTDIVRDFDKNKKPIDIPTSFFGSSED